jgi:hypothetical protein
MENPLQFGGAVLMGFGVLELIFGPFVARTTGMPEGTTRVFILTGLVTLVLGISMFWFASL